MRNQTVEGIPGEGTIADGEGVAVRVGHNRVIGGSGEAIGAGLIGVGPDGAILGDGQSVAVTVIRIFRERDWSAMPGQAVKGVIGIDVGINRWVSCNLLSGQ